MVTDVNVGTADGIGAIERANEKKLLIWRNERFDVDNAFAVNRRSETHRSRIFPVNQFGNKDVNLRIILTDCGAEVKIPITRHRSEVLAVGIDYRTKISRLRQFIALALAHPNFVMMPIDAIDRSIGDEEQLVSIGRKDRVGVAIL